MLYEVITDMTGVTHLAQRRLDQLSGGEQQRALILGLVQKNVVSLKQLLEI